MGVPTSAFVIISRRDRNRVVAGMVRRIRIGQGTWQMLLALILPAAGIGLPAPRE